MDPFVSGFNSHPTTADLRASATALSMQSDLVFSLRFKLPANAKISVFVYVDAFTLRPLLVTLILTTNIDFRSFSKPSLRSLLMLLFKEPKFIIKSSCCAASTMAESPYYFLLTHFL